MAPQLPPGVDPSTVPLSMPPPGRLPNFDNPPDSQASIVLGTGISFSIVSLGFVIMRVWTNSVVTKKLSVDDSLCVLAWVLATGYLGLSAGVGHFERHSYDIPLSWLDANAIKIYFASNFILGPMMWAAKCAILALYWRLFSRKAWLRWSCYAAFTVLTLAYWTSPILASVYCAPRAGREWDLEVIMNCKQISVAGPVYGSIAVAADILLLVLPLPIIFRLKLETSRKIALAAVFMTGIFALVASVVSLAFKIAIFHSEDANWNSAQTYAGVLVENYLTVIVSCAPAMSALWINKLSKSAFVSSMRSLLSQPFSRGASPSEKRAGSSGQSSTRFGPDYFPGKPASGEHSSFKQSESCQVVVLEPEQLPQAKSGIYTSTRIEQHCQP